MQSKFCTKSNKTSSVVHLTHQRRLSVQVKCWLGQIKNTTYWLFFIGIAQKSAWKVHPSTITLTAKHCRQLLLILDELGWTLSINVFQPGKRVYCELYPSGGALYRWQPYRNVNTWGKHFEVLTGTHAK